MGLFPLLPADPVVNQLFGAVFEAEVFQQTLRQYRFSRVGGSADENNHFALLIPAVLQ